jgi:hypothetical protein
MTSTFKDYKHPKFRSTESISSHSIEILTAFHEGGRAVYEVPIRLNFQKPLINLAATIRNGAVDALLEDHSYIPIPLVVDPENSNVFISLKSTPSSLKKVHESARHYVGKFTPRPKGTINYSSGLTTYLRTSNLHILSDIESMTPEPRDGPVRIEICETRNLNEVLDYISKTTKRDDLSTSESAWFDQTQSPKEVLENLTSLAERDWQNPTPEEQSSIELSIVLRNNNLILLGNSFPQ